MAQALPIALGNSLHRPELVAKALGSIYAASGALEFATIPVVLALSDSIGRRPILMLMPLLTAMLSLLVVCCPLLPAMLVSTFFASMLLRLFMVLTSVLAADLFQEDGVLIASLEGKMAACW